MTSHLTPTSALFSNGSHHEIIVIWITGQRPKVIKLILHEVAPCAMVHGRISFDINLSTAPRQDLKSHVESHISIVRDTYQV